MSEKELARKDGIFMVVCKFPDVCKTPSEGKPIPYQISASFDDLVQYSKDVNMKKKQAMNMKGRISKVTGDEAGSMGGVISGVNTGYCRPITHNPSVRVNGSHVLWRDSLMWMNCAGPEGSGNTIGTVTYTGATGQANVGVGEAGSGDPPVKAETALESNYLENFSKELTSPEGIVKLAQQAPQLARTDWSNPSEVLGAVGGVAGAGGLGSVAKAASLAQQGYALSRADWSDPATALSALGTAASAAGMAGSAMGSAGAGLTQFAGAAGSLAGVGQTGLHLSRTDWSNPGSVMSAASNLSGYAVGEYGTAARLAQNALAQGAAVYNATHMDGGNGAKMGTEAIGDLNPAVAYEMLSELLPMLTGLSENVWNPGHAENDPDHVPPAIDRYGNINGDTDPKTVPETYNEKSEMLAQNTYRKIESHPDPGYPEALEIDENLEIKGETGFDYQPETEKEKRLFYPN